MFMLQDDPSTVIDESAADTAGAETDAVDAVSNAADSVTEIVDNPAALQDWFESMIPTFTAWGVKIAGVLVLLLITWIVSRWAARATRKALTKANLETTLVRFFAKLTKWGVMLIGIIGCLNIFGFDATSFAAILAAMGFAIGLAFQGALSNFAAGIMLLVFRPFKVGDVVTVAGNTGKVFEIELFTTALDTPDNKRIIVPNSEIFGAVIENYSHHNTRRVDVAVGVDYPADIDQTRAVLATAIDMTDGILSDPAPAIVLTTLGDSAVNWAVRAWVRTEDYWAVMEELTRSVKMKLDDASIGIPYPQMDVHVFKENA
ncbi:MAG: mechanosensitive ion channel family protein [Planctomycetota bacterium]